MKEKLLTIPAKPGVYIFKDKADRILYVGKAKDLKNRVKSYFQRSSGLDMRKTAMIKSVSDIEYTVTGNELEALVLEANLIKQHRPRYNVLLRDDKSYPYLKLTINEEWPRLEVVRRINKDGSRYFGPYVPSGPMWKILSFIKDNFHIRTCRQSLEKRMRPCIQHQIKKCAGPCAGLINHNKYMDMINEIRLLLEGKNNKLLVSLEKKMQRFSEKLRYEEAGVVRDRIVALQKISETQKAATPGLGDIDVIGSFKEENIIVFKILFLRNGIMIGSKDFRLKNISDETPAYLMKNLIEQFYEKEIIPPAKIICSDMPEDAAILSPWLSDKKGSHVTIIAPKRGQKRRLVEMAEENAEIIYNSGKYSGRDMLLQKVAERLGLNIIPKDIGAFDISNISGNEGAFIYWEDGEFRKDRYRHIKMDAIQGPDDYSMMKEMVRRTFKKKGVRSQESGVTDQEPEVRKDLVDSSLLTPHPLLSLKVPDLIIIDGGRGHLDTVLKATQDLNIKANVISIAKNPDRVFIPDEKIPIDIEDGDTSSLFLKKIRDEAHRFAISYHRKLRAKRTFESPLEKIHGIGRKRRFELLRHFGSIEAIRKASAEEIASIKGFNSKIAEAILSSLSL